MDFNSSSEIQPAGSPSWPRPHAPLPSPCVVSSLLLTGGGAETNLWQYVNTTTTSSSQSHNKSRCHPIMATAATSSDFVFCCHCREYLEAAFFTNSQKKKAKKSNNGKCKSCCEIVQYQGIAEPVPTFEVVPVPSTGDVCLTLHQPWASLVVAGIKRLEGREWTTDFKGKTASCNYY